MKFCPKCGAYWEDIEENCKRCAAPLSASGRVDSQSNLRRGLVRILAGLCMACGLLAAFFGFMVGVFSAGLASMMRDPSWGFLIILLPVVASLPFFIVGFFLFRIRPWARRAFVVLLTLTLVPLADLVGADFGSLRYSSPDVSMLVTFLFLAAVLVFTIAPGTRRAFGQPAGLWWLEAGLAALPVLLVFITTMRFYLSIR